MKKTKIKLIAVTVSGILAASLILNGCVSTKTNPEAETQQPESAVKEPEVESEPETVTENPETEIVTEPTIVEPEPEITPEPEIIPEPEVIEPEEPLDLKFVRQLQQELSENHIKNAIELFDNLPEGLVLTVELKNLKASLLYSDSQFDAAILVCNEVLSEDADNKDAANLLVLCYHAKGDSKAYKTASDNLLKKDPNNALVNMQKAEDSALSKKWKQAREYYKKAIKGEPDNEDAFFGAGQMSYFLNDLKAAESYFNSALSINPANSSAISYLGKMALDDENYLKAEGLFSKALEIDPYNYDYLMDYGTTQRYLGKYDSALASWKTGAEIEPDYFLAYAYLAGLYDERDQYEQALENYQQVIRTNPKYFYAYEEMGILAYHLKNYDDSIAYFTKAYSYSKSYAYKLMVSACYSKKGDKFNAKNVLTQTLKELERNSLEYDMVRFYQDAYSKNAESSLLQKINKEQNNTTKGKMLFYMGLYCELYGAEQSAAEYYAKVTAMNAPMFFEYRIAEWSLGL